MKCVTCFILQAGGSSALLMDLAANEKSVHADFFNGMLVHLLVVFSGLNLC